MQINDYNKNPIKMWTDGVPVEDQAMRQLENIANMPFVCPHVAVMPDVHLGKGATVGSVIPTKGAIIPAAVGVDIGCGMCAIKLDGVNANDLPESLLKIRTEIEHAVPTGFGVHDSADAGLKHISDAENFVQWLDFYFATEYGMGGTYSGSEQRWVSSSEEC